MKRVQTAADLGRAFATLLLSAPSAKHPVVLRACARYVARVHKLHEASEVLTALERELLAREGTTLTHMESAEALSAADIHTIEERVGALLHARVEARLRFHPALLAGFRAEVGGKLIDASLHGVLSRLRAELHAWTPRLLENNHV